MNNKHFRTVEISDPSFEQNGLRFITVKTPNLKGRGDICVYVPEHTEKLDNLPIYILLHGVYGSAWIWAHKGGAHQTATKLINENKIEPCIIAMPSDGLWGDGSAYSSHNSFHFDKWIVEDVITAVKSLIPQAADTSKICIGGLSMGGYGALRLGALHANMFSAISAHSSITRLEQMAAFVEEPLSAYKTDLEPLDLIDVYKQQDVNSLPPLRFDCGTKDDLFEANVHFSNELNQMGIPHQFETFEGSHEWDYWQDHVEETLLFFNQYCKTS